MKHVPARNVLVVVAAVVVAEAAATDAAVVVAGDAIRRKPYITGRGGKRGCFNIEHPTSNIQPSTNLANPLAEERLVFRREGVSGVESSR